MTNGWVDKIKKKNVKNQVKFYEENEKFESKESVYTLLPYSIFIFWFLSV